MVQIKATYIKQLNKAKSSGQDSIFKVKVAESNSPEVKEGDYLTVFGKFHDGIPGTFLTCKGRVTKHEKFGLQMKTDIVNEFRIERRHVNYAQMADLYLFKKYKKFKLKQMFTEYGERLFTLNDNEELKAEVIKYMELKGYQKNGFLNSLTYLSQVSDSVLYLIKTGASVDTINLVMEKHGRQAMSVAINRPYSLADIGGMRFKSIDDIAKQSSRNTSSERRILSFYNHYYENKIKSGSTAIDLDLFLSVGSKDLGFDKEEMKKILRKEVINKEIHFYRSESSGHIYLMSGQRYIQSKRIAHRLVDLIGNGKSEGKTVRFPSDSFLNAEQRQAVINSVNYKVSIVTGGPGVGKTTAVKEVLKEVERSSPGLTIKMCAPTGKAAIRMEESTGRESSTIHKLLECDKEGFFKYNENNKLDLDVLVIDEFSMVDEELMKNLLEALHDHAKIIMIGDKDQLPSVSAGQVLQDMIGSKVIPTTKLVEVMRQKSDDKRLNDIIVCSNEVIDKDVKHIDFNKYGNEVHFIQSDSERYQNNGKSKDDNAQNIIVRSVDRLINIRGVSPDEIQILTPRHMTSVGVKELNNNLRDLFNPKPKDGQDYSIEKFGKLFRAKDRIIFNSTNYDENYSNGEMGIIEFVDKQNYTVSIRVETPLSVDKIIKLKGSDLDVIDLAYAKSVHKSQGSEYDYVLMPISSSHKNMLFPQLIYTSMTRAKKSFLMVGELDAFQYGINNFKIVERDTILKHVIREAFIDANPELSDKFHKNIEDNELQMAV